MSVTESDIFTLVEEYLAKVPTLMKQITDVPLEEGDLGRNYIQQDEFLISRRYPLHTLSVSLLRRLPIYLTKQFKVQVEIDSYQYWALTHDVLQYHAGRVAFREWDLYQAFKTLLASQLAKIGSADPSPYADQLCARACTKTGPHISHSAL